MFQIFSVLSFLRYFLSHSYVFFYGLKFMIFLIYGFLAKKDYSKQRLAINTPMVFKFVVSNFIFEVSIHI